VDDRSSEFVLRTFGLGKRFGGRWAVRDLSLEVRPGEIYGFLGPNGAGKSTTIRMILSLVRPTAGEVELFGRRLHEHRRACLGRVGGFVERADFYLYLPARKNLEIIGATFGGASRAAIDRVLDIVGLRDRAGDKVKTYSHGMKQRLGIAQALLGDPEFIVLDEPTSGLDPQGIKEVRDLIRRLAADHRMTVFLSSHLLSEIEQTATSLAIINQGSLVVQGPVRGLLEKSAGIVRITATPVAEALGLLSHDPAVTEVRESGGIIRARIAPGAVPAVNAKLVGAGINVHALIPQTSLEDYFLALTEGSGELSEERPAAAGENH
jgi:ABC-type multidrug transport system ATPase subunit